mmetsp:Transcript_5365/g.20383  ORF Transcript_5365/g.20383 Transcript_5365/m.20383 type:complete len:217 (-) Transcript_5365:476-1126(-)
MAGRAHHVVGLRELGALDAGDAEVGHLEPAIGHHDDVGGLDIAVPDAVVVRMAEGVEQLAHDARDVGVGEPDLGAQVAGQRAALDILHRDVGDVLVAAEVIDRDDAGVRQPAGRLGLVAKARGRRTGAVVIGVQVLADGLERHRALDVGVEALVDHAHGALAQHRGDAVFAELRGMLAVRHAGALRHREVSSPEPRWRACARTSRTAWRSRRGRWT